MRNAGELVRDKGVDDREEKNHGRDDIERLLRRPFFQNLPNASLTSIVVFADRPRERDFVRRRRCLRRCRDGFN